MPDQSLADRVLSGFGNAFFDPDAQLVSKGDIEAAKTLARQTRLLEDESEIDAQWLMSIGFEEVGPGEWLLILPSDDCGWPDGKLMYSMLYKPEFRTACIQNESSIHATFSVMPREYKTKGDLRSLLCKGLGIALKESES